MPKAILHLLPATTELLQTVPLSGLQQPRDANAHLQPLFKPHKDDLFRPPALPVQNRVLQMQTVPLPEEVLRVLPKGIAMHPKMQMRNLFQLST